MNEPSIICFRHCSTNSIFCKDVPETCPACLSEARDFLVEPFRVPYPLAKASHNPLSVVIRPVHGNFLDDYDETRDLHIGIVDSAGSVMEYDRNGLVRDDAARWTDCVTLNVMSVIWADRWDETLSFMLTDPKWQSVNYDEITTNCFDFVLEFLNNLNHPDLRFASKEDLCERLITSKIRNVVRYSSIYRALKGRKYFLSDKTY